MKKRLIKLPFFILSFWSYFLCTTECEKYSIKIINKYLKYVNMLDFDIYKTIKIIKILWLISFSFIIIYSLVSKRKKLNKYNIILSSIITAFILIGNSYIVSGTFLSLFKLENLITIIIKSIGIFYSCCLIISVIEQIFNNKAKKNKDKSNNKLISIFNKHPFLISFFLIICLWSIYYVAYYPIILSPDPSNQILQFLGVRTKYSDYSIMLDENVTITNHHPVVHTLLLGSCAKLGKIIGNDNLGLFVYSFIQGLALAATLAYTIKILKENKLQNKFAIPILLIYSFVPHFPLYALNGNKDVFYTIFFMWIIIAMYRIINNQINTKTWILLFTSLLLLGLFRNNGIYLIILLFPFVLIFNKNHRIPTSIIFTSVIGLLIIFTSIILPLFKITGVSKREAMSVVFQSTARYVQKYEEELTDDDKKIIGQIINYDSIKKYDPELADNVKNTYNKYATDDDLKKYLKLWLNCFFKHPTVYIDSLLNNTYGYFDIEKTSWNLYFSYDSRIAENNLIDYHYNSFNNLRNALAVFGYVFTYIPVVGMIDNIAFNTILTIAFGLYLLFNKKYKNLLIVLPMYITIITCMLSPANTYFRYAMPYIFTMPFVIGLWLIINNEHNSKIKN